MTTGGAPPRGRGGGARTRERAGRRATRRARGRGRERGGHRDPARAFPRRARLGTADLSRARTTVSVSAGGRGDDRVDRTRTERRGSGRGRGGERRASRGATRRSAGSATRRGGGRGMQDARARAASSGGAKRRRRRETRFYCTERDPPVGASHRAAREIPFAPTRRAAVKLLTRQLTRPFVGLLRRCASRQPFFFRPRSPRRESSAARPPRSIPPGSIARGTGTPGARGTGSRRGPDARRAGFPGEGADARAPRNRHARDVTSRDLCQ